MITQGTHRYSGRVIFGRDFVLFGHGNVVRGSRIRVVGDNNLVDGIDLDVVGVNNVVDGIRCTSTGGQCVVKGIFCKSNGDQCDVRGVNSQISCQNRNCVLQAQCPAFGNNPYYDGHADGTPFVRKPPLVTESDGTAALPDKKETEKKDLTQRLEKMTIAECLKESYEDSLEATSHKPADADHDACKGRRSPCPAGKTGHCHYCDDYHSDDDDHT